MSIDSSLDAPEQPNPVGPIDHGDHGDQLRPELGATAEAIADAIVEPGPTLADTEPAPAPPHDLARRVRRGLGWSFVNTMVSRAGSMLVGIVLARLIVPEEFGVYAAALVVINVVLSISELGVSVAISSASDDEEIDRIAPTVSTLSLASGAVLALLCAATAPWVASALGAPRATGPIRVLAVAILVAGASAVPAAQLQQKFQQERKLAADLVSFVTSTAVAILLAAWGWGAWSLAWSRIVGNATSGIVLFALVDKRYKPGFRRDEVGRLLAFGLPLAGSSLLVFAVLNVDYAVVGSVLGPTALGLYVLAFNISSWPVTAVSATIRAVALPGFAQLVDDRERHVAGFARALQLLLAAAIPGAGLLAVLGGPLVQFLYGSKWADAVAPLAFLAVLGGFRITHELVYDFLVSARAARSVLLVQAVWLAALIPGLIVAAHLNGIEGVGAGHLLVAGLVILPVDLWTLHKVGVNLRVLGRAAWRPAVGGVVMVGVALLLQRAVAGDLARLFLAGPLSVVAYATVVVPGLLPDGANLSRFRLRPAAVASSLGDGGV